jgi:hypothetical protein
MAGEFSEAELALLADEADEELLAGLAHRFSTPDDVAVRADGLPFIGHVLAATVVDAALTDLASQLERIARAATIRRRRERVFTSDPLAGQLDLGRIALALPEVDLWPILRVRRTHDTPENALVAATLDAVNAWGIGTASMFRSWAGVDLFAKAARVAGGLAHGFRDALGELPLSAIGGGQLLPLAWERLALRQAEPHLYRRAIELVEILLGLVDPRRLLARMPDTPWVVSATLRGLNEAGLQHTAFELWVASRVVDHCREVGFEFDFPYSSKTPLASGRRGSTSVEVWWQTPEPLVQWPSPLEHERHVATGDWAPLSLRPDLVIIHRGLREDRVLCVECKNKAPDAADSKDLAQAFGYLAHYSALQWCALVYRALEDVSLFRRVPSAQGVVAISAPVTPDNDAGVLLAAMVGV